ncbi:MAG: SDR family NAD(P)-dependent oxidoreductase, partial [Clostridia bacterium]|nr:SDR family NAD(P)-dependent oxidoreductase [Clostridia bacterium]
MNIQKWLTKNTHSLFGKTVVITGATGGLGRELSRYVVMLGANLVTVDRNESKSLALEKELTAEFPDVSITRIIADMEDFGSVKSACERLKCIPIDYLILNAAAYSIPRKRCDTGYDNVFQINFVSPYYLIRELVSLLTERKGRIVAVGSIAHNYSTTDPDDIDFSTRNRSNLVYGNSKRYLMFSLYELMKSEKGNLSVVHPGITFTNITAHYPPLVFAIIKHPMKLIFMKPKKAALSILKGLFDHTEGYSWIGPKLFNIWGYPSKKPLKTAQKAEIDRIYQTAEGIYNKLK